MLELSRVRRRKTKSKDWLGFRICSVLGKHIAHRCLLDKREVAIADGVVAVTEGDIKTRTTASFLAQPCGVPWPV